MKCDYCGEPGVHYVTYFKGESWYHHITTKPTPNMICDDCRIEGEKD